MHPCHIRIDICFNFIVDGNWGQWHTWTVCTKSCGGGTRTRTRYCDDPPASGGGKLCDKTSDAGRLNYQPQLTTQNITYEIVIQLCNGEECPGRTIFYIICAYRMP